MDPERRRPGEGLSDESKWEPRVDQNTLEEEGVKDPEGKFYRFSNGEKFSLSGDSGSRQPFIIEKDGKQTPFQEWKDKQSS